jgi:hypothetical protein
MSDIVRPSKIELAPESLATRQVWDNNLCSTSQQKRMQELFTQLVHHYDPEHWCELIVGCRIEDIYRVSIYAADQIIARLEQAVSGNDLLPVGDL